ncbi:RNA polymerase sigma factor [Novosphingobium colocasiae]
MDQGQRRIDRADRQSARLSVPHGQQHRARPPARKPPGDAARAGVDRGGRGRRGAGPPELRIDPAEPADEALSRRQEAEILQQAIARLPEGAAKALRMYRFEGMAQGEIAQILGISRSGVEKASCRGDEALAGGAGELRIICSGAVS